MHIIPTCLNNLFFNSLHSFFVLRPLRRTYHFHRPLSLSSLPPITFSVFHLQRRWLSRTVMVETTLRFVPERRLLVTDPHTHPVTIVGQKEHLVAVGYGTVKPKLGDRVTEEHYKNALATLSPSPTDSVPLYLNYANLIALPGPGSRHNAPSRAHCLTKAVKSVVSHAAEESVVIVGPKKNLIPFTAALARCFPMYNRKSCKDPEARHVVTVEYVLVDEELMEEDVTTLEWVAHSVRNAARIVDIPCNELGVSEFIQECKSVATELAADSVEMITIQGQELIDRGFGGIYNVGKGSAPDRQPALVALNYKCGEKDVDNVAWVGKGIVFDTGGLTIKGRDGMRTMKMDCGGAAAVLYAFWLAVKLKIKCNLSAVLCLAENSVSMNSTRIDDVIRLYSGKTVEITNTDAEGRLVLGDGVAYAKKDLNADIIVDVATLTGAQGIATGKYHAGLVTNNDEYETLFRDAGRHSGDLVHPLPFCPELHYSEFKSDLADMTNSVADGSNASSSCAGLFIFSHIGFEWDGVWVHVDMAGPKRDKSNNRATGYGVLLLNYVFENDNELFSKSWRSPYPGRL